MIRIGDDGAISAPQSGGRLDGRAIAVIINPGAGKRYKESSEPFHYKDLNFRYLYSSPIMEIAPVVTKSKGVFCNNIGLVLPTARPDSKSGYYHATKIMFSGGGRCCLPLHV